jgi:hypothetical protein
MHSKYMPPAWRVTYLLRGYDTNGQLASWRWEGRIENERYLLTAPIEGDPEQVLGRVTVTSWQPYRRDALGDAARAVLDACVVAGAMIGGLFVKPDKPPVEVESLQGARSHGGIGISDSVSFAVTQHLDGRDHFLNAIEKVQGDPVLRADLDTFQVAISQENKASSTIHMFRIYERHAQAILETQPLLLTEKGVRDAAAKELIASLGEALDENDLARLRQATMNALGRVRIKSRLDVLHEFIQGLPGCENISRKTLARIDALRGAIAHNPTVLDEEVADQEAEVALAQIVRTLLKRDMGLD